MPLTHSTLARFGRLSPAAPRVHGWKRLTASLSSAARRPTAGASQRPVAALPAVITLPSQAELTKTTSVQPIHWTLLPVALVRLHLEAAGWVCDTWRKTNKRPDGSLTQCQSHMQIECAVTACRCTSTCQRCVIECRVVLAFRGRTYINRTPAGLGSNGSLLGGLRSLSKD